MSTTSWITRRKPRLALFATTFAALCASAVPVGAAQRTYVATYGSGTACTRNAPCFDFATALSATDAGGIITCLDSGDFFSGFITKSVTIECSSASAFYSMNVNAPGAVVVLRGLFLIGNGVEPNGLEVQAGVVHVENCRVHGFRVGGAAGILFAPTVSGSRLLLQDCLITENGSDTEGAGVVINPATGVVAGVTVDRTRLEKNRVGILAIGAGTTKGVVRNSVVMDSAGSGINAGPRARFLIENTTFMGNQYGILARSTATVLVGNSSIVYNDTGLHTSSGGTINSYRTNHLNGNNSNGSFTANLERK